MGRTSLSLFVVGLCVGMGTLVASQDVSAGTQPNAKSDSTAQKPARQTQFSTAVIDQSKKSDYKAAKAKAEMEYKTASAKCRKRSTGAKRACMNDAKAARTEALAQAKARFENQP